MDTNRDIRDNRVIDIAQREIQEKEQKEEYEKNSRTYTREVKVKIKCNNGDEFTLKTKIQVDALDYSSASNKIRAQFPLLLEEALKSGVKITNLTLL